MRLTLPAKPPFDFQAVVHSHGWAQLAPNVWDADTATLWRPDRLATGRVVALTFSATPGGLSVDVAGRLTKRESAEIADRARYMFNLDADYSAFYALARTEPRLAQVEARAQGRLLRSTTFWEDVVRTLLTTNIQWSGTRRLTAALVRRFGAPLSSDKLEGAARPRPRAFPTPEALAHTRETTLRGLGLGYRAPYLLDLARRVASGRVDLAALQDPDRPTEALRRDLRALPGIGPYAANTLLNCLGRHEHIGVDTEAVAAVSRHFFAGRKVGAAEINAVFDKWGRYKALAFWFWDYE